MNPHHGHPQNTFLGWANYSLDRAKGYFNSFHSQIPIKLAILHLKFYKSQHSWTGQVPSLAQWCGRPCVFGRLEHFRRVFGNLSKSIDEIADGNVLLVALFHNRLCYPGEGELFKIVLKAH